MIHLPRRSHLPVGRLCRNLVKKTKVPTYLPLPERKKLRRKSKVPTYLPLWKGQKVGQNTKVPTYFSIWRVKKTLFFAQREKWITKTSVFFPRGVQVGANEKKSFFSSFSFSPIGRNFRKLAFFWDFHRATNRFQITRNAKRLKKHCLLMVF